MNVIESFLRAALSSPQRVALATPDGELGYGPLREQVLQLSARLRAAGIAPGEVVGLSAKAAPAHILHTLAVAHAGAVSAAIATESAAADAVRCGAVAVLHARAPAQPLDVRGARWEMDQAALDRMAPAPAAPPVSRRGEDPWRIAFSSGTTGRPKAMVFSHASGMARNLMLAARLPEVLRGRLMVHLGLGLQLPTNFWMAALGAGGTLVPAGLHGPAEVLARLRNQGVQTLVSSPGNAVAVAQAVRQQGGKRPPDLHDLFIGGAAASPAQLELLREHLCERITVIYGASEVGPVAFRRVTGDMRPGQAAGRVLEWAEVEADVDPGRADGLGRLRIRTPLMMSGYLPDPDAPGTGDGLAGGWFQTDDLGQVLPDGRLLLAGRASEVLNLAGNKVEPRRVEEVLEQFAQVREAAVLVANRAGVEMLLGVLGGPAALDPPALARHCASLLPGHLVPQAFLLAPALPRNHAGKLDRPALARWVADELRVRIGAAAVRPAEQALQRA